jgi:hypothetical protein
VGKRSKHLHVLLDCGANAGVPRFLRARSWIARTGLRGLGQDRTDMAGRMAALPDLEAHEDLRTNHSGLRANETSSGGTT